MSVVNPGLPAGGWGVGGQGRRGDVGGDNLLFDDISERGESLTPFVGCANEFHGLSLEIEIWQIILQG